MDENQMDAAVAEVIVGLMQVRRDLDPTTFTDVVGSVMVEIDQARELVLERAYRRKPRGSVIPFPGMTCPDMASEANNPGHAGQRPALPPEDADR